MECLCGYSFVKALLEGKRPYQNYALIDDDQYQEFLGAELKVAEYPTLNNISDASRFVGNLRHCPECGTVGISWPDTDRPDSYFKEITP